MKYIKLKSLTWWSGAMSIAVCIWSMVQPDGHVVGEVAHLMTLLTGGTDSSPAALIFLGMGLVGLRAAPGTNGQ